MTQRLRITFGRGEATKFISHLDMMRFWERAFRRARLPIAMTEGFHPHQRFALAAPLPVGVTSEGELMDLFLDEPLSPAALLEQLVPHLVPGVDLLAAEETALEGPSLQALMRQAVYRVVVDRDPPTLDIEEGVRQFLAAHSLPWEHVRDGELRQYDIRKQVDGLWTEAPGEETWTLGMRLQADSSGSGRPEQVVRALGFASRPRSIHRVRLILAAPARGGATAPGRRGSTRPEDQ